MSQPVGVILAAGRGRRMRGLGDRYPKSLLPIGDRPIIGHHLQLLAQLGVRLVWIIVGYRGDEVVAAVGEAHDSGLEVRTIEQPAPLGSAHALLALRSHVSGPMLVLLGDYYFATVEPERHLSRLRAGESALAAKRETDERLLREACELTVAGDGRVRKVVEKPSRPRGGLKGCGFYALQPEFFDALARTPRTALRDEYELSVALDLFVADGHPLFAEEILDWDANLTRPEDLLECNLRWLRHRHAPAWVADNARVAEGARLDRVVVGAGARITGTPSLEDVVVFPRSRLATADSLCGALVTPNGVIPCDASHGRNQNDRTGDPR